MHEQHFCIDCLLGWVLYVGSSETGTIEIAETRCDLQRAYLVAEDPTAPNFWHNVAQHVPGKTAQECQNRLWAAHPTPKASKGGNPGAYALAAEADSDTSPLMPPPRKHAAGD